jgi:hypothetical protein
MGDKEEQLVKLWGAIGVVSHGHCVVELEARSLGVGLRVG